jgi:hypothetical protein
MVLGKRILATNSEQPVAKVSNREIPDAAVTGC